MKDLKIVLVFGSFDLVHKGHEYFFKKARQLGDKLIVVLARDKTISDFKGRDPLHSENERLKHVKEIKSVDKAILGYKKDKYKIIEKIKPSVIALGYDQKSCFSKRLRKELKERDVKGVKIVRIDSYKPEKYKSSLLKEGAKHYFSKI